VKKMLFAAALVAALITMAAAQDSRAPQASIDRETGTIVASRSVVHPAKVTPGAPGYCKPCLFYAGDFDSNASDANGLANENDVAVPQAAVYAPFKVPAGKTWTVTGLFTNNFLSAQVLDPKTSPYEVRKGIPKAGGSGGHLVCHGKKTATAKPTGASDFGFNVYTVSVKNLSNCSLAAGKYWESVVPQCSNANNSTCANGYRGFETNDDGAQAHHVGSEPINNSFFNSSSFGATFETTLDFQSSSRFSDGVVGTSN